jgi:hypothetical protein
MYYRIKLKNENKYSTGGRNPKFNKSGKLWLKHHLLGHLNNVMKHNKNLKVYENCVIECFSLTPTELTLSDLVKKVEEKYVFLLLQNGSF